MIRPVYIILFIALLAGKQANAQNRNVKDSLSEIYYSVVPAGDMFIVSQGYQQALFNSSGKPVTVFRQGAFIKGLNGRFVFTGNNYQDYSELISSDGKIILKFSSKIGYVDTVRGRYRQCVPGNNCAVYDAEGKQLLYKAEDREFQYGITRWGSNGPPYLQGVIDTLGNVLLPQRYKQVVTGNGMFAAMANDTAYVFNRDGKLLFSSFAHDVLLMHNKLTGIRLYGLWALKDSTGKALTPYKYYELKDIYKTGFIDAGYVVIDARGKEVAKGDYSDGKNIGGGWHIFDSYSNTKDVVTDDQFNPLFTDVPYLKLGHIGPRYLYFSRKYSDKDPKIYDRYEKKFVALGIQQYLGGEIYVIDNKGWKQIQKDGRILDLPPFNNIRRLTYGRDKQAPIYIFSKEQDDRRGGNSYSLLPCASCERDVYGLLDTQANVILPIRYSEISDRFGDLIYAIDSSGIGNVLLDTSGKVIYKFSGKGHLNYDENLFRGTFGDTSFLFDHTGRLLYKGHRNATPLFFGGIIPDLLLLPDSLDNSALFTLDGKQLLPYEYHLVQQKIPGLATLKKNDSLYFINSHGRIMFGGRGFSGKKYFLLDGFLALLEQNGRWGIIGADGSAVLPFVYDSAGLLNNVGYFVQKDGRYALLNNTGTLMYPLQDWIPHYYYAYQNTIGTDKNRVYLLKDGNLELITGIAVKFENQPQSYCCVNVSTSIHETMPSGIYNRTGKKIAPHVPNFNYTISTDWIVITDSARRNMAVIDSNGKFLMPFIPNPVMLRIYGDTMAAVYADGRGWLYLPARGMEKLAITVDSAYMKSLHLNEEPGFRGVNNGGDIVFSSAKGKGILGWHQLLIDKDIEEIKLEGKYLVKRKGKWNILGGNMEYIQPACDSIAHYGQRYLVLVCNGRQGVYSYDNNNNIYIPPMFDAIYNPASLGNSFLVVKKDGKFFIVDKKGTALTPPLDDVEKRPYGLTNVAAVLNGQEVVLSLDADGKLNVEEAGKEGTKRKSVSGKIFPVVIFKENNKYGLYDNQRKATILPAIYDVIQMENYWDDNKDYFTAWQYKPGKRSGIDSTIVIDAKGKVLFRLAGGRAPHPISKGLWALEATGSQPVVNETGKVIVSDSFKDVESLNEKTAFLVTTKAGKEGIIDATGNYVTPPEFDEIEHSYHTGEYMTGRKGNQKTGTARYALIAGSGELLTPTVYNDISYERNGYEDDENWFIVQKNGRFGVLNEDGREYIPCVYDSVQQVANDVVVAKKKKWGILSIGNTPLTPFIYDEISDMSAGCIAFRRGKVKGILNYKWEEIIDKSGDTE